LDRLGRITDRGKPRILDDVVGSTQALHFMAKEEKQLTYDNVRYPKPINPGSPQI